MTFTVHEKGDDVRFVAEGRSIWAFVFGGFWLVWHGVWWIGLLWLGFTFALQAGGQWLGETWPDVLFPVALLTLLPRFWLMLEGGALRRWSLERQGYGMSGVIEAADLREAEVIHAWRTLGARGEAGAGAALAPVPPARTRTPVARGDDAFGLVPVTR